MNAAAAARKLALVFVAAGTLGLGSGACSRLHITPTHGRAYRATFAIQDANPNRSSNKSINGLDSQEASIIAGSYRKALAPKVDMPTNGPQLLMVNPNHGGAAEPALAPSVPSGN